MPNVPPPVASPVPCYPPHSVPPYASAQRCVYVYVLGGRGCSDGPDVEAADHPEGFLEEQTKKEALADHAAVRYFSPF